MVSMWKIKAKGPACAIRVIHRYASKQALVISPPPFFPLKQKRRCGYSSASDSIPIPPLLLFCLLQLPPFALSNFNNNQQQTLAFPAATERSISKPPSNPSPLHNLPPHQLQLPTLGRPAPLKHPPPLARLVVLAHIRDAISRTALARVAAPPPATAARRHRRASRDRAHEADGLAARAGGRGRRGGRRE